MKSKAIPLFEEYPDVVEVVDLRQMLGGISKKLAYQLLASREIHSVRIGRASSTTTSRKLRRPTAAANWTQADVPLVDYLHSWLKMVKPMIATSTHQSCKNMIDGRIDRHFRELGVSPGDLTPTQIQDFYQIILDEGYTPNTVIHYHAVLRRALQNAAKMC